MDRRGSPRRSAINMLIGGVALLGVWAAAVSVQTPRDRGVVPAAITRTVLL